MHTALRNKPHFKSAPSALLTSSDRISFLSFIIDTMEGESRLLCKPAVKARDLRVNSTELDMPSVIACIEIKCISK